MNFNKTDVVRRKFKPSVQKTDQVLRIFFNLCDGRVNGNFSESGNESTENGGPGAKPPGKFLGF